ncbi:Hypothetical predicted protein [Olea europaea subsp. europaea]|uniref:Uncharacterized protein n=1 Tax=Olea europaea subsp. europaea TaxID=158383 RepID=A0A8S0RCM8_OLEEU|nr:Hypothetical predicted protein [Olea europaea subsp. europaea]
MARYDLIDSFMLPYYVKVYGEHKNNKHINRNRGSHGAASNIGVENESASNLAGGDTLTGWRSWNPVVVEEINFPRLDTGYDAGTVVEPMWVGNDARKTWRSVSLWNSSNSIRTPSDYEATVSKEQ